MTSLSGTAGNTFARYQALLRNQTVTHVWRGHGSALFLELGALAYTRRLDGSDGNPVGTYSLMIEWSWCIESGNEIVCGSDDDDGTFYAYLDMLRGRDVVNVESFGHLPEIAIGLTGGLSVVTFRTSRGQPAWTIFDRDAGRHICVEDGELREEADLPVLNGSAIR